MELLRTKQLNAEYLQTNTVVMGEHESEIETVSQHFKRKKYTDKIIIHRKRGRGTEEKKRSSVRRFQMNGDRSQEASFILSNFITYLGDH